jgi:hypothetical protein
MATVATLMTRACICAALKRSTSAGRAPVRSDAAARGGGSGTATTRRFALNERKRWLARSGGVRGAGDSTAARRCAVCNATCFVAAPLCLPRTFLHFTGCFRHA